MFDWGISLSLSVSLSFSLSPILHSVFTLKECGMFSLHWGRALDRGHYSLGLRLHLIPHSSTKRELDSGAIIQHHWKTTHRTENQLDSRAIPYTWGKGTRCWQKSWRICGWSLSCWRPWVKSRNGSSSSRWERSRFAAGRSEKRGRKGREETPKPPDQRKVTPGSEQLHGQHKGFVPGSSIEQHSRKEVAL